jgi:hypothetical protein
VAEEMREGSEQRLDVDGKMRLRLRGYVDLELSIYHDFDFDWHGSIAMSEEATYWNHLWWLYSCLDY